MLGVVLLHASNLAIFDYGKSLNFLAASGQLGVQLFYLISAFSLMLSLDNRRVEESHYLKFYIRRIARIAPLYYVVWVFYFLTSYKNFGFTQILTSAFFINGFFISLSKGIVDGGWSISVEMIFYLFLPIFWRYIKNINSWLILFGLTLFLSAYLHRNFMPDAYFFIGYQLPVFILGCLVYRLWAQKHREWPSVLAYIPLIFFILIERLFLPYLIFSVVASVVVISFLNSKVFLFGYLMRFFGKVSYGIYLLHFLVLIGLEKINVRFCEFTSPYLTLIARFLLVVFLSTILATISYVFLEEPVSKYVRNRLRRKII